MLSGTEISMPVYMLSLIAAIAGAATVFPDTLPIVAAASKGQSAEFCVVRTTYRVQTVSLVDYRGLYAALCFALCALFEMFYKFI